MATADLQPVHLEAAGEIAVGVQPDTIPLGISQGEFDALMEGNTENPRQVVVTIRAGKSKRGWTYSRKVLEKIHGEVMNGGLPGYKGHLKAEDLPTAFPDPVTHWIGAKLDGDTLYVRGIPDRHESKLKDLIRTRRVSQASIYGVPHLKRNPSSGEVSVVDYEPISIDWTPLKRAGMDTKVVYAGEMDRALKPGEQPQQQEEPKGETMSLQDTLKSLRELGVGPKAVIEGLGWSPQQVLGEIADGIELATAGPLIDRDAFDKQSKAVAALGELQDVLGLTSVDEIKPRVEELKKTVDDASKTSINERVDKVIQGEIKNEKCRPAIKRMLSVPEEADEDAIKKAVGELLETDDVKALMQALGGVDKGVTPPPSSGKSGAAGEQRASTGATGEQEEDKLPHGLETAHVRIG